MERLSLDQKGALGSIDLTSACALLLLFLLLRRVLSSPDAPSSKRVPGPLLARYTYLPWLYHNYLLQSPKWIHHLHRQYGPVVRLSPYCVSISSPEHLTSIFSLDKEVFYDKFFNYGVAPMFSMRTRKEHSARRRIIGGQYTRAGAARPRHVAMYVEKARLLAEEMVKEAKEGDEEGTVNVFWWFSCLAMDVITAFAFGPEGATSCLVSAKHHAYFSEFQGQRNRLVDMCPVPLQWLDRLGLTWLYTSSRQRQCTVFCTKFNTAAGDAAEATLSRPDADADADADQQAPTPYAAMRRSDQVSRLDALAEVMDHVGAGHETTGNTMTYLFFELSQHPSVQSALRKGLLEATLPNDEDPCSRLTTLEGLPLLTAVIKETLRRWAGIPGFEPRLVPPEGLALRNTPYVLPPGSSVGAQPYTLHRDEEAFGGEVEEWRPDRWVGVGEKEGRSRDQALMAFGKGLRSCIGREVAMAEMRLAIAELILRFEFSLPKGKTGLEDGEFGNYNVNPKSWTCRLVVREIPKGTDGIE